MSALELLSEFEQKNNSEHLNQVAGTTFKIFYRIMQSILVRIINLYKDDFIMEDFSPNTFKLQFIFDVFENMFFQNNHKFCW